MQCPSFSALNFTFYFTTCAQHVVAKQMKDISRNKEIHNSYNSKREWKVAMNIKRKMLDNRLIVTKADKGKH
jgi:hypothetical protein